MNFKPQKLLDERQELELLKLESIGFWMLFCGTFATIIISSVTGSSRYAIGFLNVYFVVTCAVTVFLEIRRGLWDRFMRPTFRNNLLLSLIGAAISTLIMSVTIRNNMKSVGKDPYTSNSFYIALAFSAGFIFLLCLAVLTILSRMSVKKFEKLEKENPDAEENESHEK